MTTTDVRSATRSDRLLPATRVLLGAFGAVKLYGTVYFTFVASAEEGGDPQGLADWLVVAWSAALALAYLAGAARLASRTRRTARLLGGVIAADLVFSVVKLVAYDEPEAVVFMAVSLLVIGLLVLVYRRAR